MNSGFQNEEMGDAVAVGGVTSGAARLWLRARSPGAYVATWWRDGEPAGVQRLEVVVPGEDESDHTLSFTIPGEHGALRPITRYRFRITSTEDDRVVGEGRFETAPAGAADAPTSFSFAIMSCNQPFDGEGAVREDARQMLRAARKALEAHDCKFIVMMGDQIYSDMPAARSLFNPKYFRQVAPEGRSRLHDCLTAEVRRLYQQRYRHFGNIPELRDLLRSYPVYTILDDHDIVDNWGSDPAHQSEEWRSIGEGARWAYLDYLGAHQMPRASNLPKSFHYDVSYGPISMFVMDLRSERWTDNDHGQLFSKDQENDLEAFLDRTSDSKVLFFVLSVPPVHLPRALATTAARLTRDGEDFSDRWSSPGHVDDRDRFMHRIRAHQKAHPEQRHVLLAGDIHVGCAHEIIWSDDGERIYQFISSGITNRVGRPIQIGAQWLMRLNRSFNTLDGSVTARVLSLRGIEGRSQNPYGRLNLGIVRVDMSAPATPASLEYFLYGHDGDDPVCAYQTPPL